MNPSFGIIGYPLKHSLSPLIHNFWFQKLNLKEKYEIFEKSHIDQQTLQQLKDNGIKGLSVTIPYKQKAFELSDHFDKDSQLLQASNTLIFQKDKIMAYNTDGRGAFKAICKKNKTLLQKPILVLGTGGSARGILAALIENSEQVFLSGRNEKNGTQICKKLKHLMNIEWIDFKSITDIQQKVFLIIHTTPLGMMGNHENQSLLDDEFLLEQHTIFDIVYRPMETLLIKQAKKKEASIILGYEMLLYQAVLQFEYFTNCTITDETIEETKKLIIEKIA